MSIFRVGNRSIVIPSEKDNKLNDANKLVYAAYKGKVRVVKDLLAKGVESVVEDGAALKLAALKGNTTIVKLLLAVPEDPMKLLKHKHHSMDTIFISIVNAIYSGNLDTVKAIFPYKMGLRIILRDMGKPAREYLDEALQVAASIGNSDALEFLLTSTRFSKKSITNALCVCTAKGNVYGVETTLKYQPMLRV
jgi:ankyrin repeat protein